MPKRNVIRFGVSDYSKFYYTGQSTNAVSSLGNGSIVVTTTPLRSGQYLFIVVSDLGDGNASGFVAVVVQGGLSATYAVISGTEVGVSAGVTAAGVFATDCISDIQDLQIVSNPTWNSAAKTLSINANPSVNIGGLLIFIHADGNTFIPQKQFVAEALEGGTDGVLSTIDYRILNGTTYLLADTTEGCLFFFTPKFCYCSLESLDVKEIVGVEDDENGIWTPAETFQQFMNASDDANNEQKILYLLESSNRLSIHRGITTGNGMFIVSPILHYNTNV